MSTVATEKKTVIDFNGRQHNVADLQESYSVYPSYCRKMIADDGTPYLSNITFQEPGCGCKIVGNGTLHFPQKIEFCDRHAKVSLKRPPNKYQRDPKTFAAYETYLNNFYDEQYDGDWERVKEHFGQYHKSEKVLWNNYQNKTIGRFLRRFSPATFFAGFTDWAGPTGH